MEMYGFASLACVAPDFTHLLQLTHQLCKGRPTYGLPCPALIYRIANPQTLRVHRHHIPSSSTTTITTTTLPMPSLVTGWTRTEASENLA